MARYRQFSAPKERFPWLLLLALMAVLALFWVLPGQLDRKPLRIDFSEAPAAQ